MSTTARHLIIGPGSLGSLALNRPLITLRRFLYVSRLLNGGPNNRQPQAGLQTNVPGGPGQVPEPATMGMMGGALAGLAMLLRPPQVIVTLTVISMNKGRHVFGRAAPSSCIITPCPNHP